MSVSKGIALVTGSAQGIGYSIALRLARDGFDIALNDVASKRDQLRSVANDVEKTGRRVHVVPADVSSDDDVKGMVKEVAQELGGLDVMVANAGISPVSDLLSTEVEEWTRTLTVNAQGAFLCYKHAAAQMVAQGRGGRIIGASSVAGKMGIPLSSAYSASKFAIRGLTQTAALELGRYNITVNAYAPGIIRTPLAASLLGPGGTFERLDEDFVKWRLNNINRRPIKLEGQPEDIAHIVSFLASKEARFITGQCIAVDGGMIMS